MFGKVRSPTSAQESTTQSLQYQSLNSAASSTRRSSDKRDKGQEDVQQQLQALSDQVEQIQLNSIAAQAQMERQWQAAVAELQAQVEAGGGGGSPLKGAIYGVVAALAVLYVWKSWNSKPVSKLSYSKALRHVHLLMGIGTLGGVGSVQIARKLEPGPEKTKYMTIHKSSGMVMLLSLFLRLVLRLRSGIPERFPGPRPLQILETSSHRAFYLLMFVLPVSGISYTYFSGAGVPILGISKAEIEDEDADTAQRSLDAHKRLGQFLEYVWLPFHFGTMAYHRARGRGVVKRITPFP